MVNSHQGFEYAVHSCGRMYGMKEHKLTLRVTTRILDRAKSYAGAHGTTVTRLVTAYLERLEPERPSLVDAPITQRLTGVLALDRSSPSGDPPSSFDNKDYDLG